MSFSAGILKGMVSQSPLRIEKFNKLQSVTIQLCLFTTL